MDKDRLVNMARDSGLKLIKQTDDTFLLSPWDKGFADRVESAVAHDYEEKRKKDVLALVALRSEVSAQASEIVNLRRAIAGACEILDKENDCD